MKVIAIALFYSSRQVQLEKRAVSSVTPIMVANLKTLMKFGDMLPHMVYFNYASEVLKFAVSFQLQLAKMDLSETSETPFKNDVKHQMLFQLCGFFLSFIKEASNMKDYSMQHAGNDGTDNGDGGDLFSKMAPTHEQLMDIMLPQDLSDAIRRQCARYELLLQSMGPSTAKSAGHFFVGGEKDWKMDLSEETTLKAVLETADKTIGTIVGKNLKKNINDFQKAMALPKLLSIFGYVNVNLVTSKW